MRIIVPSDGALAAERRLAALMLNMEHAATAFGPDLVKLPEPHAPWPCVELKPLTRKGLSCWVHWKATVGIVFYTAGAALNIEPFVRRMASLLSSISDDHLRQHHATAASPSAVVRHKGRVTRGTLIVGPRKCYRKGPVEHVDVPARLLLWTPLTETELPPHYSIRAAFTWVFMPVTAALSIPGVHTAAVANAMIASVLYDASMLASLHEGADFYRLSLDDFRLPALPSSLKTGEQRLPVFATATMYYTNALAHAACAGALLVRGNKLSFAGQHEFLRARARPFGHLPYQPWAPDRYLTLGPGRFQCCACGAPVGGDVLAVRAPRAPPATGLHRAWWYSPRPQGSPLLGPLAGKDLLLCLTCWNALESPECLTHHMQAGLTRTVAPHTQAEACSRCPGYEGLAPLLAGSVRGSATRGAYIAKTPEGDELVLAGEDLGSLPALTNPAIASLGLPVLAGLRLAEDPSAGAPAGASAGTPVGAPASASP